MKKVIVLVVLVELVLIGIIGQQILKNKSWAFTGQLAQIITSPIKFDSIAFHPSGDLEYFYEPRVGTEITDLGWIKFTSTINNDTLNERYNYTREKPVGTYRIMVLGDSNAFGYGVDTDQNYSEQLEDLLNKYPTCTAVKKYEVINLGVPGYDIRYSVERFKLRGKKYNPDLVIWGLDPGDFAQITEFIQEKKVEKIRRTGDPSDNNWSEKDIITALKKQLEEKQMKIEDYQEQSLDTFNQHYSGPLILFISYNIESKYLDILDKFAQKWNKTSMLSNANMLTKNDLLQDFHPNQAGHKKLAEKLFSYLKENHLNDCL